MRETLDESITCNDFGCFFISMLNASTQLNTSYLKMPTNNSFTQCVKEIMHCINNEINNKKIATHSDVLIKNFYEFMLNDEVFKSIDYLTYSRVIITLKSYCEGANVALVEKYAFFEHLCDCYQHRYRKELFQKIQSAYGAGIVNKQSYKLAKVFINELLARDNYLYLRYSLMLYKNKKLGTFDEYIDYIFGYLDSFDILIPIKSPNAKEVQFFQKKGQKLEEHNDQFYCKVYDNNVTDFFYVIKENMMRIEALFNLLRLYNNSSIDFERSSNILVASKHFNETFELGFFEIEKYVGPTPDYRNLGSTVKNLDIIKERKKESYHKILNAISYAEKDKDIMSVSSYVDNWIALETLISLCERKHGYEAVESIVPKMITARLLLSDLTNTLINAHKNCGKRVYAENFIKSVCNNKFDFDNIKDPYYRYELQQYAEIIKDTKKLKRKFEEVENRLAIDILRIYLLRNEYVHASNLRAFSSMQPFLLKHLLTISIDEFFRMLNIRMKQTENLSGLLFDVFSEFFMKYENRNTAFKIINEKTQLKNGTIILNTTFEEQNIKIEEFIFNVFKNNTNLFKKYIPSDE